MASVKTAISIEKTLFEEMGALAEEMDVTRSCLFAIAAKEFIERRKSQKLLEAINAAQDESKADDELVARMRSKQRKLVKGQW